MPTSNTNSSTTSSESLGPGNANIIQPTDPVECQKAYKNLDFLSTPAARNIRIQCEFQEPGLRLAEQKVHNIVMFFGSARAKSREDYDKALAKSEVGSQERERLEKTEFLVKHYEGVRELTRRFTLWSNQRSTSNSANKKDCALKSAHIVATGGGPGMMQAANQGAWLAGTTQTNPATGQQQYVPGRSIGFGISLPFEKGLNPYVTEELAFEFHYFFTRKFWMAYKITGLVVGPGGFGTLDELFELLTLRQTGKIKRRIPVVLFGGDSYWKKVINLQAMCDFGMISQSDVDQICCTDSVDDAMDYMIKTIEQSEEEYGGIMKQQQQQQIMMSMMSNQVQNQMNQNLSLQSQNTDLSPTNAVHNGITSPAAGPNFQKSPQGPNSPFVGPMVDPSSGAYVRDQRGRVQKITVNSPQNDQNGTSQNGNGTVVTGTSQNQIQNQGQNRAHRSHSNAMGGTGYGPLNSGISEIDANNIIPTPESEADNMNNNNLNLNNNLNGFQFSPTVSMDVVGITGGMEKLNISDNENNGTDQVFNKESNQNNDFKMNVNNTGSSSALFYPEDQGEKKDKSKDSDGMEMKVYEET